MSFRAVLAEGAENVRFEWVTLGTHDSITLDMYSHVLPGTGDQTAAATEAARRGVTMPPLRAYANKNSPEGLRVEERVRRRFRKSEGVRT